MTERELFLAMTGFLYLLISFAFLITFKETTGGLRDISLNEFL
jgi:hypothetical protein